MPYREDMNRKSLRILMITPFFSPNIGGVETHLGDLCKYLQKRGHKIFVITYQPLTTKLKAQGLELKQNMIIRRIGWFGHNLFHRLEPYPLLEFIYLTPMLLGYSLFFFFRYRNEVDVIHAHGLNAAFVAKVVTKAFNKRSIVTIHAVYNLHDRPFLAKMFRWVLSSSDVVLATSEKTKENLLVNGLPKNKIRVFIHWMDQDLFRPLDRRNCKKKLGLENKFMALFVGRFIEKKGVRVLLDVTSKVDSDDTVFVFIGDGPLVDEIKRKALETKNIAFVESASQNSLVEYYNAADVLIVPSLYEEPLGRVILEALSCGTPVIASNVGGIPEIINSSVGVLINPCTRDIARQIQYFYGNPSELMKLAKNCRKYIRERFSEKNARIIEESYWQMPS